jgi:hypothetical protein
MSSKLWFWLFICEVEKRDPALMKFARGIARKHHGEPAWISVRKGPQQDGIDNAENRGIRTDPQRQGESSAQAEAPWPLPQIELGVIEEHPVAALVPALLNRRDIAERPSGGGFRIGTCPGIPNFIRFDREMGIDLRLKILERSLLLPPHAQASASSARRIRATARAIRFHSAVLSTRRFRPLAVSL